MDFFHCLCPRAVFGVLVHTKSDKLLICKEITHKNQEILEFKQLIIIANGGVSYNI